MIQPAVRWKKCYAAGHEIQCQGSLEQHGSTLRTFHNSILGYGGGSLKTGQNQANLFAINHEKLKWMVIRKRRDQIEGCCVKCLQGVKDYILEW